MLTLDDALDLCARACAAAAETGVAMSVAVMDPGGHLLALTRMDGAPWISADVAQGRPGRLLPTAHPALPRRTR